VGRTEYDLDPRLASLPSVGGGIEPSHERIVALAPDLVIQFRSEADIGTPQLLDKVGIPRLVVRPDNIGDIRRIVAILGLSVDRRAEAAALIVKLDRDLSEIAETVRLAPKRRSAFLLGGDPPLVAGSGTYLHELIEVAGGVNVFADVGDLYAPVSLETFVRRRVETILVLGEAGVPPALADLPAYVIPAQLPGLSVGAYARDIAAIFHPELFP
jgi:iron complex transport system substrate-binding protein